MVDSLAEAGTMERPMLERVANMMISGNREGLSGMFGGGGRGPRGGASEGFNERPGERWSVGTQAVGRKYHSSVQDLLPGPWRWGAA